MANHNSPPPPLRTDELLEQLDTALWRAQTVADEIRRRFGCFPEDKPEIDTPDVNELDRTIPDADDDDRLSTAVRRL